MTQTSVDRRRTGIPSSRARSALSATERTAMPASVRSRNQPRAISTTGTTMAINRSLPLKSTGKMRTWCAVSGVVTPPTMEGPFSQPGTSSWIPPKSCASPIVTTMTISRGAVKKRQRMMKSTNSPSAAPTSSAMPMQTNQLTWWARLSSTATVAARAPMAPYEKLMTREARYVRTRPRASNPLTAPNSAPLRICPRGALCGQMAGTTNNMISAAATDRTVARTRTGVRDHTFDALVQALSIFSGSSKRMLAQLPPNPVGSGNGPPP